MTTYAARQSSAPTSGPGAAAIQAGPGKGTQVDQALQGAPAQSPVQRVQTAIAARDLPGLIAIQHDLRQQMAIDPSHPPADVRDALARARMWTMERVAAIRDTYEPQITTASAGAAGGADSTSAVEAIEVRMDAECAPLLDVLLEGDPQYRYLHPDEAIARKVFAAIRLHSARRGVAQIGHRDDAEAEARAHGRVPTQAWCGAFAFTQAEQGAGFDPHWVGHMQGEGGIRSALHYGGMAHVWIWAFDHWENLRAYHQSRGSERYYEEIGRAPPRHGIQAGDIVLIDNSLGTNPDHITTAVSFDGRFLTTVGGNQGAGEQGVSRSRNAWDLTQNPLANDVRGTDAEGHRTREADARLGPKHTRIHGVGRWSLVDYERHIYVTSPQRPTAPPSQRDLAQRS